MFTLMSSDGVFISSADKDKKANDIEKMQGNPLWLPNIANCKLVNEGCRTVIS